MNYLKKTIFLTILFFIGVLTVNADDTSTIGGVIASVDLPLWDSIVIGMPDDISGSNNCKVVQTSTMLDAFIVGNDCIATGIATGTDFTLLGHEGSGIYSAITYSGNVVASVNDTSNTTVLLTEIVELIYNQNSSATKKVKSMALNSETANGATDYVLKAGSSDNALYVYGGYADGEMAGIKINFNESDQKLSYSIEYSEANSNEFYLATYFTWYLIDYIMEASPNYDRAIEIVNDDTKMSKIKTDFTSKYGQVVRTVDPLKIQVGVNARGTINNDIINLYETASQPAPAQKPAEGVGHDNPHTGAFVNIFAIVALICVGTVLVLGNKRKLFRI